MMLVLICALGFGVGLSLWVWWSVKRETEKENRWWAKEIRSYREGKKTRAWSYLEPGSGYSDPLSLEQLRWLSRNDD